MTITINFSFKSNDDSIKTHEVKEDREFIKDAVIGEITKLISSKKMKKFGVVDFSRKLDNGKIVSCKVGEGFGTMDAFENIMSY